MGECQLPVSWYKRISPAKATKVVKSTVTLAGPQLTAGQYLVDNIHQCMVITHAVKLQRLLMSSRFWQYIRFSINFLVKLSMSASFCIPYGYCKYLILTHNWVQLVPASKLFHQSVFQL